MATSISRKLVRYWEALFRRLARVWYTVIGRWRLSIRGAVVGRRFSLNGPLDIYIHPDARVIIGDDVTIMSGFRENPCGGFRRAGIWVGPRAELLIERGVGLSNSTVVAMRSVTIRESAYIGGDCQIYDTDFHSLDPECRLRRPDLTIGIKAVEIGKHAFVGGHCVILKGTRVGEGAVIGAGASITGEIPSFEVWAGRPARFLRRLDSEKTNE